MIKYDPNAKTHPVTAWFAIAIIAVVIGAPFFSKSRGTSGSTCAQTVAKVFADDVHLILMQDSIPEEQVLWGQIVVDAAQEANFHNDHIESGSLVTVIPDIEEIRRAIADSVSAPEVFAANSYTVGYVALRESGPALYWAAVMRGDGGVRGDALGDADTPSWLNAVCGMD